MGTNSKDRVSVVYAHLGGHRHVWAYDDEITYYFDGDITKIWEYHADGRFLQTYTAKAKTGEFRMDEAFLRVHAHINIKRNVIWGD